jgi:hypothetical protein
MTSLCVVYTTSAVTIPTLKMTGTEHSKTQLYQRDFVTTVSINSINTMKHIHIELHCDQLCCSE